MSRTIGLDIGSQTLRVVELNSAKDNWQVLSYAKIPSPLQKLIFESDTERDVLAKSIRQLFKEAKISRKEVSIALPETQVFTQIIEIPLLSEKELDSSMQWQAEQYIPLPLDEVSFDYKIVSQNEKTKKMRVLLSAAPFSVIDTYTSLIEKAGLSLVSVETQIVSVIRALQSSVPEAAVATFIHLGQFSSDFAFVSDTRILFTRSLPTGGNALTRAISQELNFSIEQAERYKKTYGIDAKQLEGKLYGAMKPLLDRFLSELNKGFVFFKEQFPQQKVDMIFISGGGSLMPGIVRFMTESFGIETLRGDSFYGMRFSKGVAPPVPDGSSADMVVAVGLAKRK